MPDELPSNTQNPGFAAKILDNVRGSIPLTIEQIDMMLQLIAAARGEQIRNFLDLGCGDGVLAAAILDEQPEAQGFLVDCSVESLDAARNQLHAHLHRVQFLTADFRHSNWTRRIAPHGPLDAIVSGFAIHQLPDIRKHELFRELYGLLAPEGIFINIEHVASATRWTESVLDDYMIDAIFGQELKALPNKKRSEIAREYYSRASFDSNILAPLEVQCDWLREMGFENVECYLKVQELAVFGGQRPGAESE